MSVLLRREIPLNEDYDVIVAGGGPAGCAAAAASAGVGAKTLLVEASGALGGMGTIGLVPAWCPFSDNEKIIYRGIAEKVFERTKAFMRHIKEDALDWVAIDPEALKRIYDDLVVEAGADVLFNTFISGVEFNGKDIEYIIVSNKAGLNAYKAKIFIDCTGDADLIAYCGLPFNYGGEEGDVQAVTHCFQISNADDYAYRNGPVIHYTNKDCAVYKMVDDPEFPLVIDGHSCNHLIGPGTVGFNAGHMWDVHSTDPISVSKALITGRKLAYQFHRGLQKYQPDVYAASFLSATAPAMGIRESRRVIGEYTLTVDDFLAKRDFEDEIGRNCYCIDVHRSPAEKAKATADNSAIARSNHLGPGESHGIPYRCLIPKDIGNVLAAGRNVSCDRVTLGSMRVMPPCLVTGEAAGTAAALALQSGTDIRGLDISALRERLHKNGAYFK